MYGDEEAGIPAEELYTLIDAEEALEKARYVYNIVKKLLNSVKKDS